MHKLFQKILTNFVHIAGTDREYDISRLDCLSQCLFEFFKSRVESGPCHLFRQIFTGDAYRILFPCSIYLCEKHHIGTSELFNKSVKQRSSSGICMWLKDQNSPFVIELFHSIEKGLDLSRMMGVVVIDIGAFEFPFELESPARSVEACKPVFDCVGFGSDTDRSGSRS